MRNFISYRVGILSYVKTKLFPLLQSWLKHNFLMRSPIVQDTSICGQGSQNKNCLLAIYLLFIFRKFFAKSWCKMDEMWEYSDWVKFVQIWALFKIVAVVLNISQNRRYIVQQTWYLFNFTLFLYSRFWLVLPLRVLNFKF